MEDLSFEDGQHLFLSSFFVRSGWLKTFQQKKSSYIKFILPLAVIISSLEFSLINQKLL